MVLIPRIRNALIALTVVVGTDIEDGVVLTIVPADDLVILLDEGEETVLSTVESTTLFHLCQKPRTGDDGMGLEELEGGCG